MSSTSPVKRSRATEDIDLHDNNDQTDQSSPDNGHKRLRAAVDEVTNTSDATDVTNSQSLPPAVDLQRNINTDDVHDEIARIERMNKLFGEVRAVKTYSSSSDSEEDSDSENNLAFGSVANLPPDNNGTSTYSNTDIYDALALMLEEISKLGALLSAKKKDASQINLARVMAELNTQHLNLQEKYAEQQKLQQQQQQQQQQDEPPTRKRKNVRTTTSVHLPGESRDASVNQSRPLITSEAVEQSSDRLNKAIVAFETINACGEFPAPIEDMHEDQLQSHLARFKLLVSHSSSSIKP